MKGPQFRRAHRFLLPAGNGTQYVAIILYHTTLVVVVTVCRCGYSRVCAHGPRFPHQANLWPNGLVSVGVTISRVHSAYFVYVYFYSGAFRPRVTPLKLGVMYIVLIQNFATM